MAERDDNPDAPPSAEEVAASERLRDALDDPGKDHPDADLARALRAAYEPSAIDDGEHEAIMARARAERELAVAPLPDRVPSKEEIAAAATVENDPLFAALANAWNPREISAVDHRAILEKALGAYVAPRRRSNVVRIAFGGSALALAAAILLFVLTPPEELPMARSRSTQPLFDEPFKAGETSARIDKIAIARASDYRDNRFAKWGVK